VTAIAFRFPAGRFHATPWGRHVNEGVPEWPPSPWRILRGLVAVWKRTLADEIPQERMRRLLGKLASPPLFILPPATLSHTRHFMPWEKKGPEDRTMVFDTFVAVDRNSELIAHWPTADLDADERKDLEQILAHMPYLGRSESWCHARLAAGSLRDANCGPLTAAEGLGPDHETVRVLVASEPLEFEALFVQTAQLRQKLLDPANPPGSRWILYFRRADCFAPRPTPTAAGTLRRVTVVRYALDAPVLPLVTNAVKVGDLARRAAMAQYGRSHGGATSQVLSGKDESGRPLSGHRHAFYLPGDEDRDGWIDHLTVYAPAGFGPAEQEALARIDTLHPGPGGQPLRVILLGMADPQDVPCDLFAESRVWRSITPFVLIRHPKWRGDTTGGQRPRRLVDSPVEQVKLELRRRGFPEPERIELLRNSMLRGRSIPWLAFHRWRRGGTSAGRAFGFELTFPQPVRGVIALGYGAHFGLGLFMPGDIVEQGG